MEWEALTVDELDSVETEVKAYEEGSDLFREAVDKLAELIDFAEVDTWRIHWADAVQHSLRLVSRQQSHIPGDDIRNWCSGQDTEWRT